MDNQRLNRIFVAPTRQCLCQVGVLSKIHFLFLYFFQMKSLERTQFTNVMGMDLILNVEVKKNDIYFLDVVKIRTHEFSSQGRNIYFGLKKGTIIKVGFNSVRLFIL